MSVSAIQESNIASFFSGQVMEEENVRVNCPTTLMELVNPTPLHVPEYTIEPREDGPVITFNLPKEDFTMTSIPEHHSIPLTGLKTFVHDFTFGCFTTGTDKPLRWIKELGDPTDNFTPDEIIEFPSSYLVVEYTTRWHDVSVSRASEIFKGKVANYLFHLQNRLTRKPINFFVVIATRNSIFSNVMNVPDLWASELILRYTLASRISRELKDSYPANWFSDEDRITDIDAVKSVFRDMPLILTSEQMTVDDVQNFSNPHYNKTTVDAHLDEASSRAIKDFKQANLFEEGGKFDRISHLSRLKERIEGCNADEEYLRNATSSTEHRLDRKALVQWPGVALLEKNESGSLLGFTSEISDPYFTDDSHPIFEIFCKAYAEASKTESSYSDRDNREITLALSEDDHLREESEVQNKPNRKDYRRYTVIPEEKSAIHLANLGYCGKRGERMYDSVKEYRKDKKRPFSYSVDTDDIDKFVNDETIYQQSGKYFALTESMFFSLVSSSYKVADTKEEVSDLMIKHMRDYYKSIIGGILHFISLVSMELDISLKQHVRPNEIILKKVRGYDVFLLVKPTNSSSHVLYSLIWRKSDELYRSPLDIFKEVHEEQGWCFIDLVSTNKSKLNNLVMSYERFFTILSMACEHSRLVFPVGENLFHVEESSNTKLSRARRYANLCLLVMLHDKGYVDEAMSEVRYCSMEGFRIFPQVCNPAKRLRDLTTVFRSRMQVWSIKKLYEGSRRLLQQEGYEFQAETDEDISYDEDEEKLTRQWSNLFDFFTGDSLEEVQQLINTYYYNYLKNKDENPERNSSIKIIRKIIEYEDLLPEDKRYLGRESKPEMDYKFHEFSPDLLKFCCEKASDILKQQMGNNWKDSLSDEIAQEISFMDLEAIATLKASSGFTDLGQVKSKARPKVMQEIKRIWDEERSSFKVIHLLKHSLENCHQVGGLLIDLFRKQQHAGLREISVMTAEGRIVQSVVERIARVICRSFTSEIMSHPSLKLLTAHNHNTESRRLFEDNPTVTICSSDDAKKWNQGHYVTKFLIMLMYFTDPIYHNFLASAIDLWLQKRLCLPNDLLYMMDTISKLDLDADIYNDSISKRILLAYKNVESCQWMERGTSYITTRTGMLQGILHFTSSLFQTVVQETVRSEVIKRFSRIKTRSVVTIQQSSDDSAMMITFPITPNEHVDAVTQYFVCMTSFYFKYALGNMLGIYNSSKSTPGTVSMLEFNSEFFERNSLIRATPKWVFASLLIPECDSLYTRQEQFSNLSSQVLEGGGSLLLAANCQLAQCYLNYRMLGMGVSPAFWLYSERIASLKDPALGYFLLDDPVVAGLTTLKYRLYKSLIKTPLLQSKFALMKLDQTELKKKNMNGDMQDVLETLTLGTIANSSLVIYGDRMRWNKMVKALGLSEDWREQIERNPEVLYRRPREGGEFELKLAAKAHGPGIVQSLSQNNVISRALASSVYILTRTVLTVRDSGGKVRKTTLLKKISDDLMNEEVRLDEHDLDVFFPLRMSYERFDRVKAQAGLSGSIKRYVSRRMKSDVQVFEAPHSDMFSLESVMKSTWFKLPFKASRRYRLSLLETYKRSFPWLDEDIGECLDNSPFVDHIQLQNFLSRQDARDRIVHLTSVPVRGKRGVAMLESVLYKNLWPQWESTPIFATERKEIYTHFEKLAQYTYMLSKSPLLVEPRSKMLSDILHSKAQIEIPSHTRNSRNPLLVLSLIQDLVKSTFNLTVYTPDILLDWMSKCVESGNGIFGFYSRRQKYQNGHYVGPGTWVGIMDGNPVEIHIESSKGEVLLSKVYTKSASDLYNSLETLTQWCHEHNVVVREVTHYPTRGDLIRFKYNGASIANNTTNYPPIITNDSKEYFILSEDFCDFEDFSLKLDDNNLRLTCKYQRLNEKKRKGVIGPNSNLRVTLLSLNVNPLDRNLAELEPNEVSSQLKELWSCWVCKTKLNRKSAVEFIKLLSDGEQVPNVDSEKFRSWIRSIFLSECTLRGIISHSNKLERVLLEPTYTEEDIEAGRRLASNTEVDFSNVLSTVEEFKLSDSVDTDFASFIDRYVDDAQGLFSVVDLPETSDRRYLRMDKPLLRDYVRYLMECDYEQSLKKFFREKKATPQLMKIIEQVEYLTGQEYEEEEEADLGEDYESRDWSSFF
ncbi:RNA-dependent RNA polymerase [Dar es Salaam virus TZ-189]|uniref:RNA-directed RNA polymerase L n=1 Tax=Dar es Salaam virus TZ-189 TaxID=2576944 RepID=A0A4Y6JKH1_9VIRU|nr:RNA-dependent RNA polymerase [Dar es Salaam virus TZ-189]QDF82060.1 RNA-dependent RNA polymerase [Dar es Salaam virus TZ-189]